MNAEDMKINNLVEYKNQIYIISEIFQNNQKDYFVKIENDIQDLSIPAKNVKPIQITEEWLQRFGFSKIYKSDQLIRYERPEEFIKYDIELSSKKITEGLKIYGNLIKCKYIHEFQNIFTSLFGQESFNLNNPILSTIRS
ncbi:hypothetical protein D1631_09920 [Chryseobacterium nematophagum]|uniref:Uncharacterized protein n=1 Tax=Chryseobacterium nematophagum TaxID=2305228 RepID=A0A3M7TNF6_9FLAO|nr:hypothetical protein [Chryseobacterium nematophagum]RNA63810.1 hypothetical protein D1631_09920 [Chryseobacterium nematophagum]